MIEKTVVYGFLISLSMGLSALAFFIWAVLSSQMDETEDVKYRVLERELEETGVRKTEK
jgi:cbb3-type cytochrome oxidase maturation protein